MTQKTVLFTLSKTMRPLLTLAVMLALPPIIFAVEAAPNQADWRRDGVDGRAKAALTSQGWRLEDDGRALDPKSKSPATKVALDKAVLDLRQDSRRAALETANLMLAAGKPLGPEERAHLETLSEDLPPALFAAMLDPKSDMATVKALADANLAQLASFFDGRRTLTDRRAAAEPVFAGTPGPRVDLPYYTVAEKSVGEKMRAIAEIQIGRNTFGKTVLSRLNGKDGKPALPPILIEDQNGPVVAQYDFRRQSVILDRENVMASVVGTVPPRRRTALRRSLSTRAALITYLDTHPEALAAVVRDHDVVIVHEFTHAWQDRRDTIFRDIARGNLPDTQPLEYEEEAYKTKNMYIHSKLKNDTASVRADNELSDFSEMLRDRLVWQQALFKDLNDASPSRALPIQSLRTVQGRRIYAVKLQAVATNDEQQAKALDLTVLGRGQKALDKLKIAHEARMAALDGEIDRAALNRSKLLGTVYLAQAQFVERATDRLTLLERAELQAQASGNTVLIKEVRREKERKQ